MHARSAAGEKPEVPARKLGWRDELPEKIESFGLSIALHVLLLLLLGLVTLSGGGGGRGDRPGEGGLAGMAAGERNGALEAEALSRILEKQQVKPIDATLPAPRRPTHAVAQTPRLARLTPDRRGFTGPGEGVGGGFGGGVGRGIGTGFGDFLGQLRHAGFDAVFVIDATGSMQFAIDEVREKITTLIGEIQRLVPVARVGLVLYKDRDTLSEFVVRKSNLTFHGDKLRSILEGVEAEGGGGDWEEEVEEALAAAVKDMSWRMRSRKIIVLVANSPPHEEDWPGIERVVTEFRSRGGIVSAVEAAMPEFRDEVRRSLVRIAEPGGGEVVPLGDRESMMRTLMVVAFGREWESKIADYAKGLGR